MTSSFRYPPQLLHSYTESQWLPPTQDQQSSSLDRLEAEEQAQIQRLKKLVLPENIPDPIGMDDSKKFALNAQQSSTDADASMLGPTTSLSQQPSFWERHRRSVLGDSGALDDEEDEDDEVKKSASAADEGNLLFRNPPGSAYRDRSLASTSITMSAYKRSTTRPTLSTTGATTSTAIKRMASAPTTTRHTPSPRTDSSRNHPLFGNSSDFTLDTPAPGQGMTELAAGNPNATTNSSSMMSLSHDDTTFDQDYDDEEDDDEMEED
mmetsp:Transcript_2415/g.5010  ORF Transcript_2415/g.5010 Transcript_2415/m.5010 type:complete len:265 (-) Transcript_2415:19-813(-)